MEVSGWGKYPRIDSNLAYFRDIDELSGLLSSADSLIPRGMGRSYGDSSLNQCQIISSQKFNRMKSFDSVTGKLCCEAGVSLADILAAFVSRGWFPLVTPGTKFVSIGGAIASDVHGKNHHKDGSFSSCVDSFLLLLASGEVLNCSRGEHFDVFEATFGGMGLTGFILEVTLRLRPINSAYIRQRTIKAGNLDEIMQRFESLSDYTYSVAWIDCLAKGSQLGRSVLMVGEHAEADIISEISSDAPLMLPNKRTYSVPFPFPSFALNRFSVQAFNTLYFGKAPKDAETVIDFDSFFYPLDSIHHWNNMYGKRGFTQYQCVLPLKESHAGLKKILSAVSNSGLGSFLAVLKLFGKQEGMLSFPMEGYTLALDFPICKAVLPLLAQLDEITESYGGRVYLCKDARMGERFFQNTYKNGLDDFREIRNRLDPNGKFSSVQSQRLGF